MAFHANTHPSLSVMLMALGPVVVRKDLGASLRSVEREARMVKSALLYADHITVASPPVGRLAMMASARRAVASGDLDAARRLVGAISRAEGTPYDDSASDVAAMAESYGSTMDEMLLTQPGWGELARLIMTGLLKIEPIAGGDAVETVADYLHLLDHGHGAEPGWLTMLDDTVGRLLQVGHELGMPAPRGLSGAAELALVEEAVGRIPAFPDAPLDVLLDARTTLREPLIRFRAAMARYAAEIQTSQVGPNLRRDAAALYRNHVEPELLALDELGRAERVWPALRRELAETHGGRVVSTGAALVVAARLGCPQFCRLQ